MHLRVCMRVRGRVHVREGVSDAREGGAREGAARESVREHVRVVAWRGAAWRGLAWRCVAWRCVARHWGGAPPAPPAPGVQRTSVSRRAESCDDAHVALRGRKLQERVGT